MVTRTRLQRLSDLKARKLIKQTFRRFCVCVAIFLTAVIAVILVSPRPVRHEGDLSVGLLAVIARDYLLLPIRAVSAPKR
jgi:hypothetical protein